MGDSYATTPAGVEPIVGGLARAGADETWLRALLCSVIVVGPDGTAAPGQVAVLDKIHRPVSKFGGVGCSRHRH